MKTEVKIENGKCLVIATEILTGDRWILGEFESILDASDFMHNVTIDEALKLRMAK